MVQHFQNLEFSVLVALVLEDFLDGNSLASFRDDCLEDNSEGSIADDLLRVVSKTLLNTPVSNTNSSFSGLMMSHLSYILDLLAYLPRFSSWMHQQLLCFRPTRVRLGGDMQLRTNYLPFSKLINYKI